MRRADQLLKVMSALRLCVEHCRQAASPLQALEQRLCELRQNPDLNSDDLNQIETTARRALAACSSPASPATCSATGIPTITSSQCAR